MTLSVSFLLLYLRRLGDVQTGETTRESRIHAELCERNHPSLYASSNRSAHRKHGKVTMLEDEMSGQMWSFWVAVCQTGFKCTGHGFAGRVDVNRKSP